MTRQQQLEQLKVIPQVVKWSLIAALVGILSGCASALFLWSLDVVSEWRESHRWIIALLPVSGLAVGALYHYLGQNVEGGNNLLLEEIHDPKATLPGRMAPLIFFTSVVSQLFGASVGREGAAVQMGGSISDQLTGPLRVTQDKRFILLMAGMSAGFGSIFGTPLAGAVFGLEVLAIGRLRYDALLPCFIAAMVGNLVTQGWGIHHEHASAGALLPLTWQGIIYSIMAGAIFGITGAAFAGLTHKIGDFFKAKVPYGPLRSFAGGLLISGGVWLLGTRYIGLGTGLIQESFVGPVRSWDFALKAVFTALSLGSGFKGGEVTPMLCIGATLGNALGHVFPLPMGTLTAMGFVGVFAGASNTPIASTILGMEIFGSQFGVYAGLACVASYLFSGHAGIYHSQRIGVRKW